MLRASQINQARVHNGYHYPRSVTTAKSSAEYYDRFTTEFSSCINHESPRSTRWPGSSR